MDAGAPARVHGYGRRRVRKSAHSGEAGASGGIRLQPSQLPWQKSANYRDINWPTALAKIGQLPWQDIANCRVTPDERHKESPPEGISPENKRQPSCLSPTLKKGHARRRAELALENGDTNFPDEAFRRSLDCDRGTRGIARRPRCRPEYVRTSVADVHLFTTNPGSGKLSFNLKQTRSR